MRLNSFRFTFSDFNVEFSFALLSSGSESSTSSFGLSSFSKELSLAIALIFSSDFLRGLFNFSPEFSSTSASEKSG
jgi:hypothetical protein